MKPVAFGWQRATDLPQALGARAAGALCIAGGQSLGPMLNLRLVQPHSLLEVRQLAAMRETTLVEGRLRIGAAVTHAELEDGGLPDTTQGMLRQVARNIAYRAIRNRGTLGGSLAHCDPAADWVNALSALDAQVLLQSPQQQRSLSMQAFVRGPFHTALQPDELTVDKDTFDMLKNLGVDTTQGVLRVDPQRQGGGHRGGDRGERPPRNN